MKSVYRWLFLTTISLASTSATFVFGQHTLQQKLAQEPVARLAGDVERFGNARRGAMTFLKPEMNCLRCHSLETTTRKLGPDLTEQRDITTTELIESILLPSKKIRNGFETALIQTLDGELLSGIIVEDVGGTLTIDRIEEHEQPLVIDKEEIDQWKKSEKSTMPEKLANQLSSRREFLDLVRFLRVLADRGPAAVKQLLPDSSMYVVAPLPEYENQIDHAGLIKSWDKRSFNRGKEIFRLRCASCHGTIESEGSMPTSLRFASGKFKHGNDPFTMYKTLTHGYGMMNAQRWMVPKQKYDVIHYIREHFLKRHNRSAYASIGNKYLHGLPVGDSFGPEPVLNRPWTTMDYGPSLNNTIEISKDRSNIAQKGIAIRLDSGPGGVESGKNWMLYDHDTMRVAGAWEGNFIDYNGIHFNGVHGQHPAIAGRALFVNPVGPGFGKPVNGSFEDVRVVGRDGRRYGPLPQSWLRYDGMYRFGNKSVLKYRIGDTEVLESPAIGYLDRHSIYKRQFNVGPRKHDLIVQVIETEVPISGANLKSSTLVLGGQLDHARENNGAHVEGFDGSRFVQIADDVELDMTESDYTIYAEIKSGEDGTIFCQTPNSQNWSRNGQTFFVRDGRLHFDVGWVGVLDSDVCVDREKWQTVAMTWRKRNGDVQFFVDGQLALAGSIRQKKKLTDPTYRIGFTNEDFPDPSIFEGGIRNVRFYSRVLSENELRDINSVDAGLKFHWQTSNNQHSRWVKTGKQVVDNRKWPLQLVNVSLKPDQFQWIHSDNNLRLRIPAGNEPINFSIRISASDDKLDVPQWEASLGNGEIDLLQFTQGGPANWPQELTTKVELSQNSNAFEVDVFKRPTTNPWNDRLRLTGIDFVNGGNDAIVSCWDGSVYRVNGLGNADVDGKSEVVWKRIAAGLFQPLGVRVVDEQIYVSCRDQIVRLHDLNDDGEMDWYENFNSDHQVTEHFHEFAMGLQTDAKGNFYYAKSARHALKAVVPHHGTLLKVAPDGSKTEIVANGFRAANGVCLNPDGTFFVTDQEGHWNPKNRINWVKPGGFYGNMYGYHDVEDESDDAMDPPLCWITNAFDRSPGELMWVESEQWGPLNGRLLNLSYGMGQIFVVPHEKLNGQWQGGMCALPLKNFPTGIMRGRFNPLDGQLYCCGMFAWAGNQHQPGGLYRVRYNGQPAHLPVAIRAKNKSLEIEFTDEFSPDSVSDPSNYRIMVWDLKRTKSYGSKHYNERQLEVSGAKLIGSNTIRLQLPQLEPTWCMSVEYSLQTEGDIRIEGVIHNTIHKLSD